MVQITITGGQNFSQRIKEKIERAAEGELREDYIEFARLLHAYSPLGVNHPNSRYATGAYISSHAVQFGSSKVSATGINRGLSSKNLRKGQLNGSSSLSSMIAEIESATFEQLKKATFFNESPHASIVEKGGPSWLRAGYHVYGNAKRAFG